MRASSSATSSCSTSCQRRFRRGRARRARARQFVEAKLAERDERHRRAGDSRYLVEPNIKDGKGGLRDLHTLHWLAKYLYPDGASDGAVEAGVFTPREYSTFRRCEDFLWTVRCHLHFLTGRAEERLTLRRAAGDGRAPRLSRAHGGLRAVERFMKHYFLVAKEVGDLTAHPVLGARDEAAQVAAGPRHAVLALRLARRAAAPAHLRLPHRQRPPQRRRHRRVRKDPVNLIRLFALADEQQATFSPDVLRLVRANLRLIDDKLRDDPEANRIFLRLLDRRAAIRRRAAPHERGRRARPLHSRLRPRRLDDAVQHVSPLHRRRASDPHHRHARPTSSAASLRTSIRSRPRSSAPSRIAARSIVAVFLHDIAKGRDEDHSHGRRPHRARARPAPRPDAGRDRDRRLAGRASSGDEHLRPEPRHRRPQDHPRLRRRRAEPRAAEAAAGAHRRRHPRRRPGRLERLEGPAAAHALLRDRAGARRRPYHAGPHRARRRARRTRCASGSPTGRSASSSASSTATIPTTG